MCKTFTLSIETAPGVSHIHGYHLGTIENIARQCAEDRYHCRANNGYPVVTVALIREGKLFDCYLGDRWASEEPDEH